MISLMKLTVVYLGAGYFGESKRTLKSRSNKHKKSIRNCDCENNEIAKHCWQVDHNFS